MIDASGAPMRPFLIIVGVQKSGTTLLNRLVQEHGVARSVFQTEGNDFWGNEPPFTPTAAPLGEACRRRGADAGHRVRAEDATDEVRTLLRRRLRDLDEGDDPVVNKNPYLTVGLPWVRALFPEAVIVAMVRHPVASAYSLTKKHVPHKGRGLPPEQGWWGVKPEGWRALLDDDKRRQCARQWDAVNHRLLDDVACVDRVIAYDALCADPTEVLRDLHLRLHQAPATALHAAPLTCLDHEFATGSGLRSKNRYFKELGSLEVPADEAKELAPWSDDEVRDVEAICGETWDRLRALAARPG